MVWLLLSNSFVDKPNTWSIETPTPMLDLLTSIDRRLRYLDRAAPEIKVQKHAKPVEPLNASGTHIES
jgi:hypothetical protein